MVLPNPDNCTLEQWADALVVEYSEAAVPAFNDDFEHWSSALLSIQALNSRPLPRSDQYQSWRTWAKIVQGILEK
jgi:hypothetical protein